jgi:hypothetical protein
MSEESNGEQGSTTFGPLKWVLISPPPSPTVSGEITDVFVDSGRGYVNVNFEAVVEGYSGQQCEVRWTLFDANSRTAFPDSDFKSEHAETITPSRNRDEITEEFKVPDPGTPGTYFVKLELFPPDENQALDETSSETFTSSGSPAGQQYSS